MFGLEDLPDALSRAAGPGQSPAAPPVEDLLRRARLRYRRRRVAASALVVASALAVGVPLAAAVGGQGPSGVDVALPPSPPAPGAAAVDGSADAAYFTVLLPTESVNSETPVPVPGVDGCLALPGARRLGEQLFPSVIAVSAAGSRADRAAVERCLRGLDRVRVLIQSGPEHVAVTRDGSASPDQTGRPGIDGTEQCRSGAVRDHAPGADPGSAVGYLTDAAGYEQWDWEYRGGLRIAPVEPPTGDGLYALCWVRGEVPPDGSVDDQPAAYGYQLLIVQLSGRDPGVRLDQRSAAPLPILAPPAPADEHLPTTRPGQVVHGQPDPAAVRSGAPASGD